MRAAIVAVALSVSPAFAADAPKPAPEYGWMTGSLTEDGIVGAMIVRKPRFEGKPEELAEAIDQATSALNADYCREKRFLAGQGLSAYDKSTGEWTVAGRCVETK